MEFHEVIKQANNAGYDITASEAHLMRNRHILNIEAPTHKVASFALRQDEMSASKEQFFKAMRTEETKGAYLAKMFDTLHTLRGDPDSKVKGDKVTELSLAEYVKAQTGLSLFAFLGAAFDINGRDSISTACSKMGYSELTVTELYTQMRDYSKKKASFSGMTAREFIGNAYRYFLPEMFMSMMQLGYDGGAKYMNWIAGTENVNASQVSMPYVTQGDVMPFYIAEGGAVPSGSLTMGSKSIDLYKVGVGLTLTLELIEQSSISMVSLFTSLAGVQLSRGADALARKVLISGDQPDLSESAPVIGVSSPTSGFQHYDLEYAYGLMELLGQAPTHQLTRLRTAIADLNDANPQRQRDTIRMYMGTMGVTTDTTFMPADQVLLLDSSKAMIEVTNGGIRVDMDSAKSTDEEHVYLRKRLSFAIQKRDARMIVDSSQSINSLPVPYYMDMEKQLELGFRR